MDLGRGCPPNDLEPEDLAGWVVEVLLQTTVPEGLVYWPFGALEPEEMDEVEEAEEVNEAKENEGNPKE